MMVRFDLTECKATSSTFWNTIHTFSKSVLCLATLWALLTLKIYRPCCSSICQNRLNFPLSRFGRFPKPAHWCLRWNHLPKKVVKKCIWPFFSGVPASSTYSCGHEVCTGCWAVVDWPRAEHKASKLENDVVHASGGRSSSTTGPRNNAWSGTTLKRKAQRQTWGLKMNGHYAWKNWDATWSKYFERLF